MKIDYRKNFIEKLYLKHEGKYICKSENDYINNYTPMLFICNEHGEFEHQPYKLLETTYCCPQCKLEREKIFFKKKEIRLIKEAHNEVLRKKRREEQILKNLQKEERKNFLLNLKNEKLKLKEEKRIKLINLKKEKIQIKKEHNQILKNNLIYLKNEKIRLKEEHKNKLLELKNEQKLEKLKLKEEKKLNKTSLEIKLFYFIKTYYPVISQGRPEWLGQQRFDIYLSEHNIAIEYQGKQHFESIDYFGGESRFSLIIERDERKRKLCLENNCKLYYFTYTKKDIPENYLYKVYTDEDELIQDIKNYINEIL